MNHDQEILNRAAAILLSSYPASDCKSVYTGSIPVLASKVQVADGAAKSGSHTFGVHLCSPNCPRTEGCGVPMGTIKNALTEYQADHLSTLRHGGERLRQLERIFAHFHDMDEVNQRDLTLVLSQWKGGTYNRYVAALTHFFRWCRLREYTTLRPEFMRRRETSRDDVLTLPMLRRLYAVADHRGDWAGFCRQLILTGQRRGEVAAMTADQIDGDLWRIPNTKNGTSHLVHLVHQEEITWTGKTTFADLKKRWFFDAGVPLDNRLHDIRRSFATHMVEAGEDPAVVDRILNHCGGAKGVARVYNRATLLDARRDVMTRWSEMLGVA